MVLMRYNKEIICVSLIIFNMKLAPVIEVAINIWISNTLNNISINKLILDFLLIRFNNSLCSIIALYLYMHLIALDKWLSNMLLKIANNHLYLLLTTITYTLLLILIVNNHLLHNSKLIFLNLVADVNWIMLMLNILILIVFLLMYITSYGIIKIIKTNKLFISILM